jgi:hypothetical protein
MRRRKPRRVAVAGSTRFPLDPIVAVEIVDVLRSEMPPGSVMLTRGGKGDFDQFVMNVAEYIGVTVEEHRGYGGASNWERDVAMVSACEALLAFVDPRNLTVEGGTQHLIEKALDAHRPVKAFSVVDSRLVFAGANP